MNNRHARVVIWLAIVFEIFVLAAIAAAGYVIGYTARAQQEAANGCLPLPVQSAPASASSAPEALGCAHYMATGRGWRCS